MLKKTQKEMLYRNKADTFSLLGSLCSKTRIKNIYILKGNEKKQNLYVALLRLPFALEEADSFECHFLYIL